MRLLILLFVAGILLFVGCASLAQDLSGCYSKCSELCTLAKQNNFTLDGYNQITLTKQQGNVKVYCGCPCT